jgi:argininosuccinate lyase
MEDFKTIDKRITSDVFKVLSLKNSLKSRASYGGTSPKVVNKALKQAVKKWLE